MRKKLILILLVVGVCNIFDICPLDAQIITTIVGNGTGGYAGDGGAATAAEISIVRCIYVDSTGNLFFSDESYRRVRKVNLFDTVNTFAGNGSSGFSGDGFAATSAEVGTTAGIASDRFGNVYISDASNYRIRMVEPSGIISTTAGTGAVGFFGDGGAATLAKFNDIIGITIDATGALLVADYGNARIRKIDPPIGGIVTTIAGSSPPGYGGDGGAATLAKLNQPWDVATDKAGNVYIADYGNNRIRKVDVSGTISTIAGNGTPGYSGDGIAATAAELYNPTGVAIDGCGNIYIADAANNRLRMVDRAGIITTIAGNGTGAYGGDGGPATASLVYSPGSLRTDIYGNIFFPDVGNSRVRKISATNRAPAFVSGRNQSISVCADSTVSINTMLAVTDSGVSQGETWSVWAGPGHGTLTASYVTISTGGVLTPSSMVYTPGGYVGIDSFKIVVTDCNNLSDTTTVHVTALACPLNEAHLSNSTVTLFPNPNEGTFTLNLQSTNKRPGHIVMTDALGTKVWEEDIAPDEPTILQPRVAAGIYFITFTDANGSYSEKIIVQPYK